MNYDLTEGNIMKKLLKFAFPIILGNMLQQLYNVADTLIVGRFLGENALAAVGSSYTLMVFVTSIILGLCMGSSAFFSMQFGRRDENRLEKGIFMAFLLIGGNCWCIKYFCIWWVSMEYLRFFGVPEVVMPLMREYLLWIFSGIAATFLYNYVANFMRGAWQFSHSTLFPWNFCNFKYYFRFIFYQSTLVGCRRGSHSNSNFPVCRRNWNIGLLHQKVSTSSGKKKKTDSGIMGY